jgi:hypothetical protein
MIAASPTCRQREVAAAPGAGHQAGRTVVWFAAAEHNVAVHCESRPAVHDSGAGDAIDGDDRCTDGCDRNAGPTPPTNIATTTANGHRFFTPALLDDIRSSSLRLRLVRRSRPAGRANARVHDVAARLPPQTPWCRSSFCGWLSARRVAAPVRKRLLFIS